MPVDTAGEITVSGQVTVNGQPAVSNATVLSGAVITTGADSSATVSLGKNGRVEMGANSSMTLNFGPSNIIVMVDSGKVRIASAAGVAATATSKNGTVIADSSVADNFALEVECSHTHVDTMTGSVTLREGSNDRQVAAGSTAVAGNIAQAGCQPCLRPGSTPGPAYAGGLWWLALAAAGAGIGIYLATRNNDDFNFGGNPVVISPAR
jgi:ferric-dicitrate binding protein FerR (iron transport regulator)